MKIQKWLKSDPVPEKHCKHVIDSEGVFRYNEKHLLQNKCFLLYICLRSVCDREEAMYFVLSLILIITVLVIVAFAHAWFGRKWQDRMGNGFGEKHMREDWGIEEKEEYHE